MRDSHWLAVLTTCLLCVGPATAQDRADPELLAEIGRLRAIDDAIRPVVADLAEALDRYGRYAPRFAAALARLEAGELEWFTKPLIDSYHTVWFELHEDLLSTLGLERSKEDVT